MTPVPLTRRQFTTAAAVAGAFALAGCLATGDRPASDEPTLPTEPEYGDWFDGVSTYARTLDYRGRDAVEIGVGTAGDFGYFKFDPVAVSPGTTVTWRWTGKGGGHDVVADNGTFASGDPVTTADHTFGHTFDAPGVHKYYCTPHRAMGMRGAVFVALEA